MKRWIVLLLIISLVSIINATNVEIKTYSDENFSNEREMFKNGDIVYFTVTNSASCCDDKISNLVYDGFPTISVDINDEGKLSDKSKDDGLYTGSFTIGENENDAKNSYLHADNGKEVIIYTALTSISPGSASIQTDYISPSSTAIESELVAMKIFLNWIGVNDNNQISHYNIYRANQTLTEENKEEFYLDKTTELNYVDTNPSDGVNYNYAVSGVDAAGNMAPLSNIENIETPDITPPEQITNFQIIPKANGKINLNWDVPNDNTKIKEYIIYKGATNNLDTEYTRQNTNNYTEINNIHDKKYYYGVAAVDSNGNIGEKSEIKSITTDLIAPNQIDDLKGELFHSGKIKLAWSKQNEAVKYNIYYSKNSDLSQSFLIELNDNNTFSFTPNKEYYYMITSLDQFENEAKHSNIIYLSPDSNGPERVNNFIINNNNDLSFNLEWDESESTDINHYNIYRKVSNENFEFLQSTYNNNYKDVDLIHGLRYEYYIQGIDDVGNIGEKSIIESHIAKDLILNIEITSPVSGSKISQNNILITGNTKKGSNVKINNYNYSSNAIIDNYGNFLGYIQLESGENLIEISVTDLNLNTKNISLIIISEDEETTTNNQYIINQGFNYSLEDLIEILNIRNSELQSELESIDNSPTNLNKEQKEVIEDLTRSYIESNIDKPIGESINKITNRAVKELNLGDLQFKEVEREVIQNVAGQLKLNDGIVKKSINEENKPVLEKSNIKFPFWSYILIALVIVIMLVYLDKRIIESNNHSDEKRSWKIKKDMKQFGISRNNDNKNKTKDESYKISKDDFEELK